MDAENPYSTTTIEPTAATAFEPLSPPQEVVFTLGEEELIASLECLQAESDVTKEALKRARKRFFVLSLLTAALGGMLYMIDADANGAPPFSSILCWILATTWLLCLTRLRKLASKEQKLNNTKIAEEAEASYAFGKKAYKIDEQGLTMIDVAGSRFRYWWAIDRVQATDGYLFIFVTKIEIASIPATAFINESSYAAFCDLTTRLWSEGQASKPAPDSAGS